MNSRWTNSIRIVLAIVILSFSSLACNLAGTSTPAPAEPDSNTVSSNVETQATDTPAAGEPEPTAAPAEPDPTTGPPSGGEVTVEALWFAQDASGPFGGTSRVGIEIERASQPGELRVGFFEEEVAGTGDMWHAAGWTAVTFASMVLGLDPSEYEFAFSVGGRIDGPSAGGLMTVGVLAAFMGDTVREDAAMTGTINPDGTIGPVGGIPQKIQGAAERGKTLVLVPAGSRRSVDYATGELVDVVDVGNQLGVEVVEVATVYQAYERLTGNALPRAEVTQTSPQLPTRAYDRVETKAREWLNRFQDELSQYSALAPEVQELFTVEVAEAMDLADRADSALQQGLPSVAYSRAWQAATLMRMYNLAVDILLEYFTSGLESTVALLNSTAVAQSDVDTALDYLATQEAKTVSDYLTLFEAYGNVSLSQGLIVIGNDTLGGISARLEEMTEEEILVGLTEATLYYSLARTGVELARDAVEVGMGFGTTPVKDEQQIARLSNTLRRAAEANIAYFESTIIEQYADAWNMHPDAVKSIFMSFETDYQWSKATDYGYSMMASTQPPDVVEGPLLMGLSLSSYPSSSGLVAKYYSLDTQLDQDGNVVQIGNERAIADMLQFADERALELINLNGDDAPVLAIMYYESARIGRQGNAEEQLGALQDYWSAATMAMVQAYLSGKLGAK